MRLSIKIRGARQTRKYLQTVRTRAESNEFWQSELMDVARMGLRFACSISPVVTGSYRGAHRLAAGGKQVTLSIDPTSRNVVSGVLVTDYADDVERRHQVYGRTAVHIDAEIDRTASRIVGRLLDEH